MFQFTGFPPYDYRDCSFSSYGDWGLLSRVSPFRDPRIRAYLQLPVAFRSLSRLSSALSAKASTLRSCSLNLSNSSASADNDSYVRCKLACIRTFESLAMHLRSKCHEIDRRSMNDACVAIDFHLSHLAWCYLAGTWPSKNQDFHFSDVLLSLFSQTLIL